MTHGSLFSGIGGFDLAAEWIGWENVFHCEIDKFCQKILKHYWPHAKSYKDIKETDFTEWKNQVDIISGGFPCQPYSIAGKRKGKEDDRHLWPEMLRAIREVQPRWIVGENVFGLINWSRGLVFHEVQIDLETAGYEVWPYVLPACAVNAPHRRDRIWFIAHRNCNGYGSINEFGEDRFKETKNKIEKNKREWLWDDFRGDVTEKDFANANKQGLQGMPRREQRSIQCQEKSFKGREYDRVFAKIEQWENFPTKSPFCIRNDGFSSFMDSDTFFRETGIEHPRKPAIGFSKWRTKSIMIAGNTVVPLLVYQIFKAIESYDNTNRD